MADRRLALKGYFLEVVRDLVARGIVRQQAGQSLADVLRSEPRAVLDEVQADFVAVAAEIGVGLLGGLEVIAKKNLDSLVGSGVTRLAEYIASRGKAKR